MKKFCAVAAYVFVLLFYLVMSINIPLTGDDLTWKSYLGMERLRNFFEDYNGRYLSNIFEIILVRNDIVRYATLTLVSFFIVFFLNRLVFRNPNSFTFLLSFVLIMIMPVKIFAQTYGWTAGYVNYVISILCLLLYMYYDKFLKSKQNILYLSAVFLLAIATQLLVEHVTLYAIFLAIVVLVKDKVLQKKFSTSGLFYLLGSVIGAVIMFSNGAYLKVLNKEDTYRTIGNQESLSTQMFITFSNKIQQFLFVQNYLVILLLSIILIVVLFKTKKLFHLVSGSLIFAYILFLTFYKDRIDIGILPDTIVALSAYLSIFYVVIVLINLVFLFNSNRNILTFEILFYFISSLILTLPFLVLTPYGGRGALASYVFLVMCMIKLVDSSVTSINIKPVKLCIVIASIFISVYYLVPIVENGNIDRQREVIIKNTDFNSVEKLTLPGMPFKQFHQMPDPFDEVYQTKFYKIEHNIPQDIKIEIKDE